jgi:hypothetical protein
LIKKNNITSEAYGTFFLFIFLKNYRSDNGIADHRADASTTATIYLGVPETIPASKAHLAFIISNLTQDSAGIARYWNDIFFYESKFNPGGQEVGG